MSPNLVIVISNIVLIIEVIRKWVFFLMLNVDFLSKKKQQQNKPQNKHFWPKTTKIQKWLKWLKMAKNILAKNVWGLGFLKKIKNFQGTTRILHTVFCQKPNFFIEKKF